ncbi:MAG: hypothetical protein PHS37_06580, partial [Candidatus Omnitrophica bacterium]|nr:hypothetical protein [Candidatus Omnitrophota bacterium]
CGMGRHGPLLSGGHIRGCFLYCTGFFSLLPKGLFFSSGPAARKIWSGINVIFFFHLICLGWLIFRASSVQQALDMFHAMIFNFSAQPLIVKYYFLDMIFLTGLLLVVEFFQRKHNTGTAMRAWPAQARFYAYLIMFYLIVIWGDNGAKEFIYFQF